MADYSEYEQLAHAMQSGVAMQMEVHPGETTPKHLRVGINSAMSDHGALVKLLIDKGVFTEDEYLAVLVEFMRREVESYEQQLTTHFGTKITLR